MEEQVSQPTSNVELQPAATASITCSMAPSIVTVATPMQPSLDDTSTGDNIVVGRAAPAESSSRGRGRGGARGRGRGKPRSSISGTKVRKRKRNGQQGEEDETASSSDEVSTPTALMTKSGRSVQRPTAYVPPANASPNAATADGIKTEAGNGARVFKKKRVWRRNAENAVCKSCLRGTSPASNMIVFCDGCNTPYHRWCHHPPINQNVIDESDKEWYCRACSRERVVPVPEHEVAHWTTASNVAPDERRQFFMSLTPGTMVTLLTRATTMQPSLPLFAPEWASKHTQGTIPAGNSPVVQPSIASNGLQAPTEQPAHQQPTIYAQHDDDDEDEGYGAEEHPPHYVRPGKGLMSTLPPDKDDDKYLVDEESSRGVFHHVYLIDEDAVKPGEGTDKS